MGFSKNRIRYLINKKNKFQTKKKYKKKKKEKRQKKNSFRKKKINIRNSSIKKKRNKKKNIAKKKRKVYIIKGGGRDDLNPYDQMIHDILVNVFKQSPSDTTSNTTTDNTSENTTDNTSDNIPAWYDTSFLYDKNDIITGEYIDRNDAINQFKKDLKDAQRKGEGNNEGKDEGNDEEKGKGEGETLAGMDYAMEMECKADETLMMIDGNSNAITFNKTKCHNDVYKDIHTSIINIIDGSLN